MVSFVDKNKRKVSVGLFEVFAGGGRTIRRRRASTRTAVSQDRVLGLSPHLQIEEKQEQNERQKKHERHELQAVQQILHHQYSYRTPRDVSLTLGLGPTSSTSTCTSSCSSSSS